MKDLIIMLFMLVGTLGPLGLMATVGFVSVRSLGQNPSHAPRIMMGMIIAMLVMLVISMGVMISIFYFAAQ